VYFDWLVGHLGRALTCMSVAMECAKDGDVLARAIGDEKFGRAILWTLFFTPELEC